MALVGDDAGHVAALADADQDLLRGKRSLGDAAEPLKAEEAVRLDLAHDKAELIHMRKQHYARPRPHLPGAVAIRLPRTSVLVPRPRARISLAILRLTRPSCPLRPGMVISSRVSALIRSRDGKLTGMVSALSPNGRAT